MFLLWFREEYIDSSNIGILKGVLFCKIRSVMIIVIIIMICMIKEIILYINLFFVRYLMG